MFIFIFFASFIALLLACSIKIVHQNERCIVESFGKYRRTLQPGFNYIFWPIHKVASRIDTRIREYVAKVEVKTVDDAFVGVPVNIQYQVRDGFEQVAYYRMTRPSEQLKSWVLNALRAAVCDISLAELFGDRHKLEEAIQQDIASQLAEYGLTVVRILIDQPSLSPEMEAAFNSVITAQRNLDAAKKRAEVMKQEAIGEADAQRERAKGLADSRQTLAEGLAQSASVLAEKNISPELSMQVLVDTNRIDALRKIGETGNLIITDLSPYSATAANLACNIGSLNKPESINH